MSLGMKTENFQTSLSGKPRKAAETQAIRFPNKWPLALEDRRDEFLNWRHIAMQVLQRNALSYRVIATFDLMFDLEECACWATDEEFSREGGYCSAKTISRDITAMRDAGIIITRPGWVDKNGKKVKGRKIELAIPLDLRGIHIR